jgi:DNA-binding phage protein
MLRASSQTQNLADDLDLTAVIDSTKDSGLPHGALLIAFVDAVLGKDGAALNAARNALLKESGPEALVDAAGVIATFMQMVRIADATGIAIDTAILEKTQEVRETLGINTFASAQNTLGPNA